MQDIVLLLCVSAVFVSGLFVMKRIDAFLARNAQNTQRGAAGGKSVLRIAFSDPMTANATSRALELIRKAHPNIEISLYTADADTLLERLYNGQVDAALLPCAISGKKDLEYDTADVMIEQCAVAVKNAVLPLCPLTSESVIRRLIWAKCACNGAAADFASHVIQDSQRRTGNAC